MHNCIKEMSVFTLTLHYNGVSYLFYYENICMICVFLFIIKFCFCLSHKSKPKHLTLHSMVFYLDKVQLQLMLFWIHFKKLQMLPQIQKVLICLLLFFFILLFLATLRVLWNNFGDK